MTSTMWALTFDRLREDWATSRGLVRERLPVPTLTDDDDGMVLLRVLYAGFCGSDRSIWSRQAFGDMILGSLEAQGTSRRLVGHELVGEILELHPSAAARHDLSVGDVVAAESHLVCGTCAQCRLGEYHVCQREEILGITVDGAFAEVIKLPARVLWRTDVAKIRPEVAAIQEPFGNAVHACQVTDLRGKTVAILGTGTIGLFAVLIARAMGASRVLGVDPHPGHRDLAARLGADHVLTPQQGATAWAADPALREAIFDLTEGVGVDVALEMSGHPSSLNNALQVVRRGGHVVLFGVKNGDATVQDFHRVVMNGLQLHGVVGRRLWHTWQITRRLLEDERNGIQDAIWRVLLDEGRETLVDVATWSPERFEDLLARHPKLVLRFEGSSARSGLDVAPPPV